MGVFRNLILVGIVVLSILLVVSLVMEYSETSITLEGITGLFNTAKSRDDKDNRDSDWIQLGEAQQWEEVSTMTLGSVDEKLLLDEEGLLIRLIRLSYWEDMGIYFELSLENRGEDDIYVDLGGISINDVMIYGQLSELVEAGDMVFSKIYINKSDLNLARISTIKDVAVSFEFIDSNSFETVYESEPVSFSVKGTDGYIQDYGLAGIKIYEEHDLVITLANPLMDSPWGKVLPLYIENNSQEDIYISTDELLVNGKDFHVYFGERILAGKKVYGLFYFFQEDLKSARIKELKDLEVSFVILNTEDWNYIDETRVFSFKF